VKEKERSTLRKKNTNIPWVRMHFSQNKASCRIKARLAKTSHG